jgi:hypothetical protein
MKGSMHSPEDGMTATGIPDRVKHEMAIMELKDAVKEQADKIDALTNIITERTEEGILHSFEQKMADQLSAQSEKFEVMLRGIGNQIDRLGNSSNYITSSSSSREVLPVPTIVPESHVETSLLASVGIPSHSIIQANVSTDVELALALKTEITAWKAMTPQSHLHHWAGCFHYNAAPLDITGFGTLMYICIYDHIYIHKYMCDNYEYKHIYVYKAMYKNSNMDVYI